jgi:pyridoxine 5-phosphate synthase
MGFVELGVNIDHVATVRQARRTVEPDPVAAAVLAELGGADSITVHLREDRRHIQDRDVRLLAQTLRTKMNFELSVASEIVGIACEVRPHQATLVPEKREEVTTEGGLDLRPRSAALREAIGRLRDCGVSISLFIDPDREQVEIAKELAVDAIELHTGQYASAHGAQQSRELDRLTHAGQFAVDLGLRLHAGHGLTYTNVYPIASIPNMFELNIGHSIVSRAVLVGMQQAVSDMKRLLTQVKAV